MDHNTGKLVTGKIPEEIGALSKLTYLELDNNTLDGSIPASIYNMTDVRSINLSGNNLTGTISEGIANLTELILLKVQDNNFTGPQIPSVGLSSLEKLRKLSKGDPLDRNC
jgi:Leucine-rich repeat (LRR) protein